jgi:hypothetical protein
MSAFLAPGFGAGFQAFNNAGQVLSGGKLYTYTAGSTSNQATWTSSNQSVTNANPIILNSAGRSANEIWLQGGTTTKFVLADSTGVTIATWDNVAGLNDASYQGFSEWVPFGSTPTYVTGTSFTVSGNQTITLQVGRRLQFFLLGGTFYATVASSTFNTGTGLTTVTQTNDSTAMDNTLYAFSYGFMSAINSSLPTTVYAPTASPVFTGNPTAPTRTPLDNTTNLATTAYTDLAVGVETTRATGVEVLKSPIASPAFTGLPTAPTAPNITNNTQLATTAFVNTFAFSLTIPSYIQFMSSYNLTAVFGGINSGNA